MLHIGCSGQQFRSTNFLPDNLYRSLPGSRR
jgi:hypothetical protein